ncbi:hypothetical protein HID58_019172 [Brassica napus]|uniref:Neprosin PEP catalytic domain-containing protein n=1 Tax=Brassica napus TaxID=3708 RepID=A0ABQ8DER3_BRANA|nr:hypothetical protein HID58_019172 [Brassica napus]
MDHCFPHSRFGDTTYSRNFPKKSKLSNLHEQKIELRLKQLNKPAIKPIHSPDRDMIVYGSTTNQLLIILYSKTTPFRFLVDGHQKTGCYNTDCPCFVQTSNRITVGGTFKSVSKYDGVHIAVLNYMEGTKY